MNRIRIQRAILPVVVLALSRAALAADAAHEEARTDVIGPYWAGMVPAILTILIFLLLLVVLSKYAWGPIATGLRAREQKIRKDIADAEAARQRAEATLREYQTQLAGAEAQVRELMQSATAQGEKIAAGIRLRAQEESEQIKEKAQRDIDAAGKQAIREIYDQAAALSTGIAEKILRRSLNADDQRDLVNGSLDQLQTLNRA